MRARLTTIALLLLILPTGIGCSKAPNPEQQVKMNRELLQAVDHHDLASARRWLDNGASIETTDNNETTLLGIAASNDDLAMAQMLLQRGAKAHVKDHALVTPLMHAAYGGHTEIVRLLLQQNPDPVERNEGLLEAVHSSPAVVIMEDTQKSGSANQGVPLHQLRPEQVSSAVETVKLLLDRGADIEATDQYRGPPLVDAAAYAQTDVVILLLERGANLHVRDKYGNTALIAASCECAVATMNSAYDVVRLLLEKGADVNAQSKEGTTALMNAAGGFGGSAIVQILLEHGADPRARDSKGNTALKFAKEANREDKMLLIKRALANTDKR